MKIIKKHLVQPLFIIAGSIAFVIYIYQLSFNINHSDHGFIRLFPPHLTGEIAVLDINYNSYYISGMSSGSIFLGNKTSRDFLFTNHNLTTTQHLTLALPSQNTISASASQIIADSPYLYLFDGLTPNYLLGNIKDVTFFQKPIPKLKFGAAVPMSPNTAILKIYDNKQLQTSLIKRVTYDSVNAAEFFPRKQQDGLFSVDGMLRSCRQAGRIIYTYYYRNEFHCLDTNLNLIYTGHTIDTFSHADLKIEKINAGNGVTMGAPPVIVNRESCVSENNIFVNSSLRASNENENNFNTQSVIDVYDLATGKYRFSFYVQKYKGIKMDRFMVYENTFAAIYDRYLITIRLNF